LSAAGYQSWDDALISLGAALNLARGFGGATISNLSPSDAAQMAHEANDRFMAMRYQQHQTQIASMQANGVAGSNVITSCSRKIPHLRRLLIKECRFGSKSIMHLSIITRPHLIRLGVQHLVGAGTKAPLAIIIGNTARNGTFFRYLRV
jgi:hypothetical protein